MSVVVVGVVALGFALWNFASGPRDDEAQGGTPAPSITAPANPTETPLPTPTEWPTPTPGATDAPDPEKPVEADIDEPAVIEGVATARIVKVESFDAGESQIPGQLAGPAVRITVEVVNDSAAEIDLRGSSLNLDYGSKHTPASVVGDPVATGLTGMLAPGAKTSGEYSFNLPLDQRDTVRVILDLVSGESQIVFMGEMPGD